VGVERALYKGGLLLGDGPMHDSLVLLHFEPGVEGQVQSRGQVSVILGARLWIAQHLVGPVQLMEPPCPIFPFLLVVRGLVEVRMDRLWCGVVCKHTLCTQAALFRPEGRMAVARTRTRALNSVTICSLELVESAPSTA